MNLSVALATYNEELNIGDCLESVKDLADEIVIVDGGSNDKTLDLVKKYTENILVTTNPPMFHINKQKAIDRSRGKWILLLDADERVTGKLSLEIKKVINMDEKGLEKYQSSLKNKKLFLRHQEILEERDGAIGAKDGKYSAFFIPRVNFFLGKYLKYGGVYPDGVIRLFKKGEAYLPCKDVHEQMVVNGKVGWLENELLHRDSPTFKRYLKRNGRYIDLMVLEFQRGHLEKNLKSFIRYCFLKPLKWFFLTQIRHKGVLDGFQGIIFSFFSALRFPRAYLRYLDKRDEV